MYVYIRRQYAPCPLFTILKCDEDGNFTTIRTYVEEKQAARETEKLNEQLLSSARRKL